MTEFHNYNTPTEGTLDWHIPLNENFEQLDADVEIRDVESNLSQYAPKSEAKFLATDTGRRFVGDGIQWTELQYPVGSTEVSTPATIVWANKMPGADLSEKVQNALDTIAADYGGRGIVKVAPRADGQNWQWNSTVTFDTAIFEGPHIDIVWNTQIDVDVDSWAFDISNSEAVDRVLDRHWFKLTGGDWIFDTSADPDGWLRATDVVLSEVAPRAVWHVENSTNDAIGVYLRSDHMFNEVWYVHDVHFKYIDVGIRSSGPLENDDGGGSSDDFYGERLMFAHFDNAMRFRTTGHAFNLQSIHMWPGREGSVGIWHDDANSPVNTNPAPTGNVQVVKWEAPGHGGTVFKNTHPAPISVMHPWAWGGDSEVALWEGTKPDFFPARFGETRVATRHD